MNIFSLISQASKNNTKQLAVLIDPDKSGGKGIKKTIDICDVSGVDYIFAGGSLIKSNSFDDCILQIKALCNIPIVLFPGSVMQLSPHADALLFLSLISGRNPEMLIGNHVIAAPHVKNAGLEVIPAGYILVESGKLTSVVYMSNTTPIPNDKTDIAICTAMAGEMLGHKLIYMDAGSGAQKSISNDMVRQVKANISIPLVVGGGIRDAKTAEGLWEAGADILVLGNIAENKPEIIKEIGSLIM